MQSREPGGAGKAGLSADRAERWLYAVEAVAFGLPTLGVAIPGLLAFGFLVAAVVSNEPGVQALLAASVFLGGVLGVTAWCVLSGRVLFGERKSLQRAGYVWWVGLVAGIAASGALGWPMVIDAITVGQEGLIFGLLASGLLLWIPSFHLILMRLRT